MKNVARMSDDDHRVFFRNTADKTGIRDAIVEKDFWVCYTLDYLFHRSPWASSFAFKGGTALSRIYHLTERFSEDIDLILDWRLLGYGLKEPWEARSNTKQDAFNKEANKRAEAFLAEEFVPRLSSDISEELNRPASIYIDKQDSQVVLFAYPRIFSNAATLPVIRIEAGALSAWTPAEEGSLRPYVSEQYPDLFEQPETSILTVSPERTFWEKATILHHEAHRPENSKMPERYSRHYYDLVKLAHSSVKEKAFTQLDLLQKVVDFKIKFYPRGWAKYAEAVPGTLQLVPPEYRFPALRTDYAAMQDMIYGDAPSFDEMMDEIQQLENEINKL